MTARKGSQARAIKETFRLIGRSLPKEGTKKTKRSATWKSPRVLIRVGIVAALGGTAGSLIVNHNVERERGARNTRPDAPAAAAAGPAEPEHPFEQRFDPTTSASGTSPSTLGAPSAAAPGKLSVSRYGAFRYVDNGDDCELWFDHASGGSWKLFAAKSCAQTLPPWSRPEEVEVLDGFALPVLAKTGDEFHLFQIPTARGGNATPSCDYYAVVIDGSHALSSGEFTLRTCAGPEALGLSQWPATLVDDGRIATLTLVQPATGVEEGRSYNIRMGSTKLTLLPKLPRTVVSDQTVAWTGSVNPPFHVTNWLYSIGSGANDITIDHVGACALQPLVGRQVEITLRRRTWSPEATEYTCLSVHPAKP